MSPRHGPPFTVLHVCIGNICRSPMAERLFALALRQQVGDRVDDLYLSHGAGTGAWHVGESMNPPAARQVTRRGGDPAGFRARKVSGDLIDASDLILCATAEQVSYVLALRPDAASRTFVLGEFGRLLAGLSPAPSPASPPALRPAASSPPASSVSTATSALATSAPTSAAAAPAPAASASVAKPDDAHARGVALVAAADAARGGARSRPSDDLDDPWGMSETEFARIADEIERTVIPLARALTR